MDIQKISLLTIIADYLPEITTDDIVRAGKNQYSCKCPIHKETNGSSFIMYEKPTGWDWTCFGKCSTGGNAAKLLTMALPDKFPTIEDAAEDIREKYNLVLPDVVDIESFARYKNVTPEFLVSRGIENVSDGILIHYYDANNEKIATKKRLKFEGKPKYKFTFGSGNAFYGLELLKTYQKDYIYLVEGESDALTMMFAGIPVLGIPGSLSWQPEWAAHVADFKKIIVINDNDIAGMKLFTKLQESFGTRLYARQLPQKVKDASALFNYYQNGDVSAFQEYFNINSAVPATPEAFKEALNTNKELITNKDAWFYLLYTVKDEAERIILLDELADLSKTPKRAITLMYKSTLSALQERETKIDGGTNHIFEERGCYCKWNSNSAKVQVTNFTVKLHHTLNREGEYHRLVTFQGADGTKSAPILLDARHLANANDFNEACISRGNYMFDGNTSDLNGVRKIILAQESPLVVAPSFIGHVDDKWILGDVGIDTDGEIVEMNEFGAIPFADGSYKPANVPALPFLKDITLAKPDFRRDVAYTLKQNIGTYEAWLALGWVVSVCHSDTIFKHQMENNFPLLFVTGKRNSGKSHLARWIMRQFGLGTDTGMSNGLASDTLVAMSNKLSQYASMPIWWDDYRNSIKDILARGERLLLTYNRSGRSKGKRTETGNEIVPARACVMLSGEDTPTSDLNALSTRCVFIQVSANQRDDSVIEHMLELVTDFDKLGLTFMCDFQKNGSEALLTHLDRIVGKLMSSGIDSRGARNIGVTAAGFLHGYGDVIDAADLEGFENWLVDFAAKEKASVDDDQVVTRFLYDLAYLIERSSIVEHTDFVITEEEIFLNMTNIYNAWRSYCLSLRMPVVERNVLNNYLRKETWFTPKKSKRFTGLNNKVVSASTVALTACVELKDTCDALHYNEEF